MDSHLIAVGLLAAGVALLVVAGYEILTHRKKKVPSSTAVPTGPVAKAPAPSDVKPGQS